MNNYSNKRLVNGWIGVLFCLTLLINGPVQAGTFESQVSGLSASDSTLGVKGVVRLSQTFECYSAPNHPIPSFVTDLHMQVTSNADDFNVSYALLLSALATGQTVTFEYSVVAFGFFQWCQIDSFTIE